MADTLPRKQSFYDVIWKIDKSTISRFKKNRIRKAMQIAMIMIETGDMNHMGKPSIEWNEGDTFLNLLWVNHPFNHHLHISDDGITYYMGDRPIITMEIYEHGTLIGDCTQFVKQWSTASLF